MLAHDTPRRRKQSVSADAQRSTTVNHPERGRPSSADAGPPCRYTATSQAPPSATPTTHAATTTTRRASAPATRRPSPQDTPPATPPANAYTHPGQPTSTPAPPPTPHPHRPPRVPPPRTTCHAAPTGTPDPRTRTTPAPSDTPQHPKPSSAPAPQPRPQDAAHHKTRTAPDASPQTPATHSGPAHTAPPASATHDPSRRYRQRDSRRLPEAREEGRRLPAEGWVVVIGASSYKLHMTLKQRQRLGQCVGWHDLHVDQRTRKVGAVDNEPRPSVILHPNQTPLHPLAHVRQDCDCSRLALPTTPKLISRHRHPTSITPNTHQTQAPPNPARHPKTQYHPLPWEHSSAIRRLPPAMWAGNGMWECQRATPSLRRSARQARRHAHVTLR